MKEIPEKTCIIYCRVSSHDQIEGTSLDTQEQLCREYADRNHLSVLGIFTERGESAKTADRTELNRALEFCKRKRVRFFLVYKLDRFTRNQYDHVTLRAVLRRSNTELRSVTEPIDDTPVGKLIEGVLSSVSQFDNDQRTERVVLGMRSRLKEGVWLFSDPLGYRRPRQGANIEPDPATAPLVRLAFEEFAKGTYTFERLAQFLNNRGLRARRGGNITASRAQQLIQNPVYAGIMRIWGEEYDGSFKPLVSRDVWERCQPGYRRKEQVVQPRSFNNPLFPLRGFVACYECGTTLTGSRSKGGRGSWHPYYHHYNRACTRSRFVPKQEFESAFIGFLHAWDIPTDKERMFRELVVQAWKEDKERISRGNAAIQREVARFNDERQQLFDLHRSGIYSDTDFVEQRRVLDSRIREKTRQLRGESDYNFDLEYGLRESLRFLRSPGNTWAELNPDYPKRLEFQRHLLTGVGKIEYDGRLLRTADLPLIYKLIREMHTEKSKLVDLLQNSWGDLLDELRRWVSFGRDYTPPP